jgi:hypothetical protein
MVQRISLIELRDHPEHYNPILDLFLTSDRTLRPNHAPIYAAGVGLDGGVQQFWIRRNGILFRRYEWITGPSPEWLPSLDGKVVSMLWQFGYDLDYSRTKQAELYLKYIRTGVSNLYKYE